jgi:hypothetical protein
MLSVGAGKIALTVGLCLCAGQLVATPASAATVGPRAVSTTALVSSVAPRVTLGANTRTIGWGSKVRLTAKLVNPRTGKAVRSGSVRLQVWRDGAWHTWQTRRVSSSGTVSFTAEPHITGSFRTQFTGATGLRWGLSKSLKVTVRVSGAKILSEAKKHRGARYRFGASGPRTFDCSGYTMYVYKKAAGKKLPHKANAQQRYGRTIARSKARPGDLIVVRSGSYGTHAGVYAGGGYMWDSPHAGSSVGKHKIWTKSYVVKRLV